MNSSENTPPFEISQ